MTTARLISAFLLFSVSAFLFSGCLSDGTSAVSSANVTAGYTPDSGMWTVGVTLTFKNAPTRRTRARLKAAGAVRLKSDATTWHVTRYDRDNATQVIALDSALREGATLTITK